MPGRWRRASTDSQEATLNLLPEASAYNHASKGEPCYPLRLAVEHCPSSVIRSIVAIGIDIRSAIPASENALQIAATR